MAFSGGILMPKPARRGLSQKVLHDNHSSPLPICASVACTHPHRSEASGRLTLRTATNSVSQPIKQKHSNQYRTTIIIVNPLYQHQRSAAAVRHAFPTNTLPCYLVVSSGITVPRQRCKRNLFCWANLRHQTLPLAMASGH